MVSVQPQALPKGAKLVRIGTGTYRVVWDLGNGLGHAWYTIDKEHLTNLYKGAKPPEDFWFANTANFEGEFGNFHWGNIAEVTLKAETPWEDLTEKIQNQFGFVPGLGDQEIRRLLMQSFWEGWSENQWTVEYRKTNYFNKLSDDARAWVGLSTAEKNQRVGDVATEMTNQYRSYMGKDIDRAATTIQTQALKIASGVMTMDHWLYALRTQAAGIEGTPIWRQNQEEDEAALAEGNEVENFTLAAENQWRDWVGPVAMPEGFAAQWGNWLASGQRSEADFENYLKQISQTRWAYKPADLTWKDWSASYKAQIRDELELPTLDDKDSLLTQALNSDMTGQDLTQMIRADQRFLSTEKMYGELASAASDMGRRFGFIT